MQVRAPKSLRFVFIRPHRFLWLCGWLGCVVGFTAVMGTGDNHRRYLPFMGKPASGDPCQTAVILVSPPGPTYPAGTTVDVMVAGLDPVQGTAGLHWARTSAPTHLPGAWTPLPLTWEPDHTRYRATFTLPAALTGPPPYDSSPGQEFMLALTLQDETGTAVCAGELAPVPALSNCSGCNRLLVSASESGAGLELAPFWQAVPGYSVTYLGQRLDAPEEDDGSPANGDFVTRLEYEAPLRLCGDTDAIPQRWTKSNRWGYWLPAAAQAADRDGSFWTEGNGNYRFFVTHPAYDYPWVDEMMAAYAQKVYRIEDGVYQLGQLGNVFDRTILNSSRQGEYFHYPPYLLSLTAVPQSGAAPFVRLDSSYHYAGTEAADVVCQPRPHTEDHYWYTRVQPLTDPDLTAGFAPIQQYFTETKPIAVLTFFEAIAQNDGRTTFREDWYLMQDVGVVGIDQAYWEADDAATAAAYFQADFMKEGTAVPPHVRLRADRAYLGHALQITPLAPGHTFPLIVNPGDCYTVAIHSQTAVAMPYDGLLEHDYEAEPGLWRSAQDGQPHWAQNGLVTSCLPPDFPSGETRVHLRPAIRPSPSAHEAPLPFAPMPWSVNELWVIVP